MGEYNNHFLKLLASEKPTFFTRREAFSFVGASKTSPIPTALTYTVLAVCSDCCRLACLPLMSGKDRFSFSLFYFFPTLTESPLLLAYSKPMQGLNICP